MNKAYDRRHLPKKEEQYEEPFIFKILKAVPWMFLLLGIIAAALVLYYG